MMRKNIIHKIYGAAVCMLLALCTMNLAHAQSESSYKLGHGDQINIQVFDEPDLTMTATIGESGFINYSYLGNIQVANKTPLELENEITALLRDGYLVNPSVNITISEYRPFFVNGEVGRPGGYPYQPGLTLDKAIAIAGGLTDRASRRKIYVLRAESGGERERIKFSQLVAPGDIINVEEGFF